MSKSTNAYSNESNRDRIGAVLERRRSNASGAHGDRRLKRQRTRAAVRLSLRRELT